MKTKIINTLARMKAPSPECPRLAKAIIPLNNLGELRKCMGWTKEPVLNDPTLNLFEYVEDANERRLRDAEILGASAANQDKGTILEIGTAEGRTTALLAENAPDARIFTVNIPPEEILEGKGGTHTTFALERERIGKFYKNRGFDNITQILANTATWQPDIGSIDMAFIDGCHDTEFVYNDSRKVLAQMKPGSIILWHDFNYELRLKYGWIQEVCLGVEMLIRDGLINGRIFHVRDSWIGVYRVG